MGFEIERFQGDVDEEFICPICSGVLEDPLQAPACEHTFCRACISEWVSRQPTCPVDRQAVTASQLRPVPRLMRNLLSRLSTSCDYAPHGCNAVLNLDFLASHLVKCKFNPKRPMPCEAGCGLVIPKDELAEHNCVRELRALIVTQLNDYKQELAEHKRTHQGKLKDNEQELAEHKRELALLKEFMREMRLSNPSMRPSNPSMRLLNPSTRALADQKERQEVVRWANSLERVRATRWDAIIPAPGDDVYMMIKGSLSESGCPPHIINELMENCRRRRWPVGLTSLPTSQNNIRLHEKYVCKRVPGKQAVVVLDCDNPNVNVFMMAKPGFVVIFEDGIE